MIRQWSFRPSLFWGLLLGNIAIWLHVLSRLALSLG